MTAATVRRDRLELAAEPNVIPFIDVLLVLLIIFMVTAPRPTTDLRADLPRPGPTLPIVIPPTIVELRQAPEGFRIYVGGHETAFDQLERRVLAFALGVDPALTAEDVYADGRVFVRADLDVAYQHVVSVVERLQDARFQKVAIIAQSADDEG